MSVSKCFYESFANRARISCKKSTHLWILCPGSGIIIHRLSKDEALRDFGYSMIIVVRYKEINFWEPTMVTVSYLVYYDTLLQNVTDTQTAIVILLQNAKSVRFFITKYCDSFITKFNIYYKMR